MFNYGNCDPVIVDLEILNLTNSLGCAAGGRKFTLGESVVPDAGDWGDELRYVHENEAVCDRESCKHVVRGHSDSPVQEPPNEPKKSPIREPGKPAPKPPTPNTPPVEEPPEKMPNPPVKEPPPRDPDRESAAKQQIQVRS